MEVEIELPYPPTVNHYWGQTRSGGRFLKQRATNFRQEVCLITRNIKPIFGRVSVEVDVYPPDRRKRDLDNLWKALADSLQHARLISDDECIDQEYIRRCEIVKGGKVVVRIKKIGNKDLEPCALCGGSEYNWKYYRVNGDTETTTLSCASCRLNPDFHFIAEGRDVRQAIARWNKENAR